MKSLLIFMPLFLAACDFQFSSTTNNNANYHEAVICTLGQGNEGEYMHFRRKNKGLAMAACKDALTAYTSYYRMEDNGLYCSPTSVCPKW